MANTMITSIAVLVTLFCVVGAVEQPAFKDIMFAEEFLKQYHYLSPLKNGNHDWKTALELYQRYMDLPATGQLDKDTIKEMRKPRCGVADVEEDKNTGIVKRFGVSATPWSTTKLTYGFVNYCQDLSKAVCESVIARAFKLWSDNSVLTFTKLSDVNKAHIKISFVKGKHSPCLFDFDGPGKVLAHAEFPNQGNIHFDEDETFTDGTTTGTNLYSVAAHEIGHVIGISHQNGIKGSIMYNTYKGYTTNLQLHTDDINAVAYLYGGATVQPAVTQPPACADSSVVCGSYLALCTSDKANMQNICARSCGFCTSGQINQCVDEWDSSWCVLIKNNGGCSRDDGKLFCAKTCNVNC